jgi:hypothetical protein
LEECGEEKKVLAIEAGVKTTHQKPNLIQQDAHLGPGIIKSLKKYENIKLQNFIETLFVQNVSAERFATEIERFFLYHSIKKTKVIQTLQSQLKA